MRGTLPSRQRLTCALLCNSLLLMSLGSLIGCGGDRAFGVAPAVARQYWALSLNHHAVTLSLTAPSNQLQLTAVPLTATGDTIATDARVHFTSTDSAVQVDSTGLLTAHSPKAGVFVIAALTLGGTQGATLVDTAEVNVNAVADVPVFHRLEVHTPGDSATYSSGSTQNALTVSLTDTAGNAIPQALYYVAFADTTVASNPIIASGGHWSPSFATWRVGQTRVIVSATVYGVSRSDTLDLKVRYPIAQVIELDLVNDTVAQVASPSYSLGTNGIVVFENRTQTPVDILFDDSTAVQSATAQQITDVQGLAWTLLFHFPEETEAGNIHALSVWTKRPVPHTTGYEFRRFPTPGTYTFHTQPFNATGTIHVD